jgi:hypothetical protein
MRSKIHLLLLPLLAGAICAPTFGQRIQFPESPSGLRPITPSQGVYPSSPAMVPINPATQSGVFPSTGTAGTNFDPYSGGAVTPPPVSSGFNTGVYPPGNTAPTLPPNIAPGSTTPGGYPQYNGPPPAFPGAGPSGTVGTFSNTPPGYSQPGMYPNNTPSALFPGNGYDTGGSGNWFGGGAYGQPPGYPPNSASWNPEGAIYNGGPPPDFIRLFQGPRFRQAYIWGNNDEDALAINDTDVSLAITFPNFLFSTQPLYLLPSFSLHQWSGPKAPSPADLPPLAYSAFLDSGWQSDPARIWGGELGLRVGMFSAFDANSSESLRILGRAIGRVRLTPTKTLKLGVVYLDRNKVKLLPAFGILCQPSPDARFDLFFPEPKISSYVSTIGTMDTWWYVAGYYGGGNWTVLRTSGEADKVDINDIRLVLGLEWGKNEQMREGRRVGFAEFGFVFNRELIYKYEPQDNIDLQNSFMVRVGIGY